MTPTIQTHSDDAQKAVAVLEDLWKILRHFKVGLFARDHGRMCVAISEPSGSQMFVGGVMHATQTVPSERKLVKQWTDRSTFEMFPSTGLAGPSVDARDGVNQVLNHFGCALIPSPALLLCDKQADGRWRAFAVIGALDAYGYTWRPVKETAVQ
jgi:hypothetical protein